MAADRSAASARRVDWPLLAFWLGYLVFFTGFCVFMVWVAERVAA